MRDSTQQPLIKNPRFVMIAAPLLVGILVLLLWEAIVIAQEIPKYILPAPSLIISTLFEDWSLLMGAMGNTLYVTFLAFAISVVLGSLISFLFVQSRWIEVSFFPYAVILQVTPVVAVAPLIIIWIDNTTLALTICAVIIAIFPIISNTTMGLRSVNTKLVQLFDMYQANRWQKLLRMRIPSALPYFFGGLRISSGLALIGAVVAEFVAGTGGSQSGLAYVIMDSGYSLNIPRMFAALLLITLCGIALFAAMSALSHYTLRNWHESAVRSER